MKRRIMGWIGGVAVAAGCSGPPAGVQIVKSPSFDGSPVKRIAVFPLADPKVGTSIGSGEVVANTLAVKVHRALGAEVIEQSLAAKAYRKVVTEFSEEPSAAVAQNLGRELGADAVVIGSVTNYQKVTAHDVQYGHDQTRWTVGAVVRILSVRDGAVLYEASYTTRWDPELPAGTVADALEELTENLAKPLKAARPKDTSAP